MNDKEALKAAKILKKYCDERKCEICIFNRNKCMLRGWPAPALWPLAWLKEKFTKGDKHDVR
ncbi:MAG: hypothetical protein Q4F21_14350 [Lachnospiraceae bacterium]|nr:hypothetical protein [Lachnospiraceae bacterium]